jgi:hypothetical protein
MSGCREAGSEQFGYKWLDGYDFKGFEYGPSNIFVDYRNSYILNYKKAEGFIETELITHEIGYYDFDSDITFKGDTVLVSYKLKRIRYGDGSGGADVIKFNYKIQADTSKSYILKFIYPQGYGSGG